MNNSKDFSIYCKVNTDEVVRFVCKIGMILLNQEVFHVCIQINWVIFTLSLRDEEKHIQIDYRIIMIQSDDKTTKHTA